jgi:predicted dehydrogenase
MGANHARVIAESDLADLTVVVDRDIVRAQDVAERFGARASTDLDEITRCDAAVIASSTPTHVDIAMPLLAAGVPLLIEKPLAEEIDAIGQVLEASRRASVPVMCGFVERFNPALVTARSVIDAPVIQFSAVRHSPQNPVATSSVVYDLLVHDIDIALRTAHSDTLPTVSAGLWGPKPGAQPEIAECVLGFSDGMLANLSASRWGQRKIREVRIATEQQLVEVDLLRVSVTVYRHISQSVIGNGRDYRAETIVDVPYVRHRGEPLAMQLAAFVDLIRADEDAVEEERASILPPHIVAAEVERR